MDLTDYQLQSQRTLNVDWPYREQVANAALGLAGEAGEIADLLKKYLYHGHELDVDELKKELGDCAWYLAALCSLFDLDLSDVAQSNVDKLMIRFPNGFTKTDSIARRDKTQC